MKIDEKLAEFPTGERGFLPYFSLRLGFPLGKSSKCISGGTDEEQRSSPGRVENESCGNR